MNRFGKKLLPLLLVGLVTAGLLSSRVDAQRYHREYKSGPYVDPIFPSPLTSAIGSSYTHGHAIDAVCPSCGMPAHAAGMHGDVHGDVYGTFGYGGEVLVDPGPVTYAMPQGMALGAADMTGRATNCPPPTNALLRVWVDERATVKVNYQPTKPQKLAGANRGSRIFSLTGFAPGEIHEAVVEVAMVSGGETVTLRKTLTAQAGQRHEVRFTSSEFVAARPLRRVSSNLLVLYDFKHTNDIQNMVYDVSQQGSPLDLLIDDPFYVQWSSDGLQIMSPVLIQSGQTADKIRLAVQQTNEISVEAWVTPADSTTPPAASPARIVSLSKNPSERNFTLGQQDDAYDVRLRTTNTNPNGTPSLKSLPGTAPLLPTHVVFTCDGDGTTKIYLNGRPFSRGHLDGDFSQWDGQLRLLLANEQTKDRPWLGTLHLVAIYSRALSDHEVTLNHLRGYN